MTQETTIYYWVQNYDRVNQCEQYMYTVYIYIHIPITYVYIYMYLDYLVKLYRTTQNDI